VTDPGRECGTCSVCCSVLAVPELDKSGYEVCRHLCASGCAIYPDRPESCRSFTCEWLRGSLEVDGTVDPGLRPDKHILVELEPEWSRCDDGLPRLTKAELIALRSQVRNPK